MGGNLHGLVGLKQLKREGGGVSREERETVITIITAIDVLLVIEITTRALVSIL